jgi:hypothetical protein
MQTTETAAVPAAEITAEKILDDLLTFVNRRTGMDVHNYAQDWRDTEGLKTFRSEYREILRDGRDARTMILACRHLVPASVLLEQGRTSDRLTYGSKGFDYCTGQYWCTEYRAAACWYLRRCYRDALIDQGNSWEQVKQRAKREFGLGIARRWFS